MKLFDSIKNFFTPKAKPVQKAPASFGIESKPLPKDFFNLSATQKIDVPKKLASYGAQVEKNIKNAPPEVQFIKSIVQAIPRAVGTIAKSSGVNTDNLNKGSLGEAVFGSEPIKSISEKTKSTQEDIKSITGKDISTGFAGTLAVGGTLLDLIPGGKSKKGITDSIEAIAKSGKVDDIIPAIKSIFKEANIAKTDDEIIALATKYKDIDDVKTITDDLAQQVKPISVSDRVKLTDTMGNEITPPGTSPTKTVSSKFNEPEIDGKEVNPFLNPKRYDLNPQEAKVFDDVGKKVEDRVQEMYGGRLTNKEVREIADDLTESTAKIMTRDEQAIEIANMVKVADALAEAVKTGDIARIKDAYVAAKSASTFSGRLLQASKIAANAKSKSILTKMADDLAKTGGDLDQLFKDAENVDFNDPTAVTAFFRKYNPARIGDWIDVIRYNSMLTSPKTFTTNLLGNILAVPETVLVKTGSALIDSLNSILRPSSQRSSFLGEVPAFLRGFFSKDGFKSGYKAFSDVMTGNNIEQFSEFAGAIPLTEKGTKARLFENFLKFIPKLQDATDRFLSEMLSTGVESANKFKAGKLKQLYGKITNPSAQAAKDEAMKMLYRGEMTTATEGILTNAIGRGAEMVGLLRDNPNPLVKWPAKFIFPFLQFGTNALKRGVEYNPILGTINTLTSKEDKIQQFSKVLIGTATMGIIGAAVSEDKITFSEPVSYYDKNNQRSVNVPPYSIKIGDKWVSYKTLPPFISFNIATMAAIKKGMSEGKISDSTGEKMIGSLSKVIFFFADQSYMRSIGDLSAGLSGDESAFQRMISNYPQQLIPFRALMGSVARIIDENQRQPNQSSKTIDKQFQYLLMNIPGLSKMVPARRDSAGNPVSEADIATRIWRNISPVDIRTQTEDQAKSYEDIIAAKKISAEYSAKEKKNKQKVDLALSKFDEAKTNAEKKKILFEFKTANPDLTDSLAKKINTRKKYPTVELKNIESMGIKSGERAAYIADKLSRLKTTDEKKEFLQVIKDSKLLTADVQAQLKSGSYK
jgi:hypothetical protein